MKATIIYNDKYDEEKRWDGREDIIEGVGNVELFELFYKANNRLRYCNGCYYTWKDIDMKASYTMWLNSDDYNTKSFNLYYGNGIVD